jgi:hypothetical protein
MPAARNPEDISAQTGIGSAKSYQVFEFTGEPAAPDRHTLILDEFHRFQQHPLFICYLQQVDTLG